MHARRAGNRLLISFGRVHGARNYVTVVSLRDGLRTDYEVTRGPLSLPVPTVGPLGGTVTVVALGDGLTTRTGTPSTASIKVPASGKPRHRRS